MIDSDDVFDARMQRSPTTASSSRKSSRLTSSFSTIASITTSQSDSSLDLVRRVDAGERGVRVGFLDLAFCGELVQCVGKIVARGGDRLRVGIEETHGESAERRDLRDAAPHRAAADDADCLNLKIAKAHGVARLLMRCRISTVVLFYGIVSRLRDEDG